MKKWCLIYIFQENKWKIIMLTPHDQSYKLKFNVQDIVPYLLPYTQINSASIWEWEIHTFLVLNLDDLPREMGKERADAVATVAIFGV